ncbi:N6-adenosine-methyltransferase subunit METTL3 [Triplophysa tibetana]|uniref:mRNA m(6)A methyltransferase n=1 Tax=Triplophysa tibetana TaxID=1572043 RepID=A0A5A9PMN5_9TELE|nr:N6-adenosine-methyltransferase subunit METTL3 [Triplophysa tibetana]
MSDTWSHIQAHKKQLDSLRERLQRRRKEPTQLEIETGGGEGASARSYSPGPALQSPPQVEVEQSPDPELERRLLGYLSELSLSLPTDSLAITNKLNTVPVSNSHLTGSSGGGGGGGSEKKGRSNKVQASHLDMEIESLLSQQSTKEQQSKKVSQEILELLNTSSAKEQSIVEKFRSRGRAQVQEFCDHGTKEECVQSGDTPQPCTKLHFRRIINKHTDESLGDCSFLNTCFHMDTCKYVHYEIDSPPEAEGDIAGPQAGAIELGLHSNVGDSNVGKLFPSQWICCDIRYLDVSILGKFAVVMADPPWDIHMELPYGTLTDDEMRKLNIPILQDDGFLFLWVTGRAMELGRECLSLWGYDRVDEIIWVKTNQLQRIIRTGRTGHWLNHGKEHCLVGVKGNPQGFNRGLDCDVIVAEVRSTSHKPDEIYGMIERLSPGTRKIEMFGRPHNVQPNWITLGNQLDGIHLLDPEVVSRFKKRYPDGVISKPKNM